MIGPQPLAGETVLCRARPSLWFILLARLGLWLMLLIAGLVLGGSDLPPVFRQHPLAGWAGWAITLAAVSLLTWSLLDWLTRTYLLTDRRIVRASGVLRRAVVDVPLANVQSVTLIQSIRERCFGLGTIGVSSAGSQGFEFTWFMVGGPEARLRQVRAAVEAAAGAASRPGASQERQA